MENPLLEDLLQKTEQLSPNERLQLAARLIDRVREEMPETGAPPKYKWRDIRGMAKPSMFGEDAQAYISRTRKEDTEHREKALKRKQ